MYTGVPIEIYPLVETYRAKREEESRGEREVCVCVCGWVGVCEGGGGVVEREIGKWYTEKHAG